MEQEIASQIVGLGGASDFSLWSLFIRADFVVNFVIILLIASSIFSWALIFDKFKLFKAINKSTEDFEKKFWKSKSAESFNNNLPSNSKDPATLIFKAAMNELVKTKRQSSAVQTARVQRIIEISTDNVDSALKLIDELKVIAMQISAMKPMGIDENSINSKIIKDEKDIILKQLDKVPDDKKDQIIQGKLNKFLKENTLLGQALITDPKKSVGSFLSEMSKNNNISLNITSMDLYTI